MQYSWVPYKAPKLLEAFQLILGYLIFSCGLCTHSHFQIIINGMSFQEEVNNYESNL